MRDAERPFLRGGALRRNPHELVIAPRLEAQLGEFWQRWGERLNNMTVRLPDFQNPNWVRQIGPPGSAQELDLPQIIEAGGPEVVWPYYLFSRATRKEQLDALADLVGGAGAAGSQIIIDVGCGRSLIPLTTAGRHERTIVIGLDNQDKPPAYWPWIGTNIERGARYDGNFPYVAYEISSLPFSDSAAFFFQLDATDVVVSRILANSARRVQFVCPYWGSGTFADGPIMLHAGYRMTQTDGEMWVVNDIPLRFPSAMSVLWRADLWPRNNSHYWRIIPLVEEVGRGFRTYRVHNMSVAHLSKYFGIGHSGWFNGTLEAYLQENRPQRLSREPSRRPVAVFRGKKRSD